MSEADAEQLYDVVLHVNGVLRPASVPARRLLSDCLRHDLRLTGTHVGCEHGVCGACTVLVDGRPMRSCLMLAVRPTGHEITTVEGLGTPADMHPVQQAFRECHGLQCGFCTPGFLTTIAAFIEDNPRAVGGGGPRQPWAETSAGAPAPEHRAAVAGRGAPAGGSR